MPQFIRNSLAFVVAVIMIVSGKVRKARRRIRNDNGIISIYFHDPSRILFTSCIKWLQKKGYQFISLEMLEQALKGTKPIPQHAVVITIDDGWRGNINNVVEYADDHQIPVAIFVSTSTIEHGGGFWWSYIKKASKMGLVTYSLARLKAMANEERMKIMSVLRSKIYIEREAFTRSELVNIASSRNITIGGHTDTHPILTNCTYEEALFEVNGCKTKLEQWVQREVRYFSYPNGDFTSRESEMVDQSGFVLGFTTVPKYITINDRLNLLSLPRFEVLESASFAENICRMSGAWFTN